MLRMNRSRDKLRTSESNIINVFTGELIRRRFKGHDKTYIIRDNPHKGILMTRRSVTECGGEFKTYNLY